MTGPRLALGAAAIVCLSILSYFIFGAHWMSDPTRMSFCHIEDKADFLESVASYDRRPLIAPTEPVRQVTFTLRFPFPMGPDDILLVEAFAEGRGIAHRFYDGPPPPDGLLPAALPAQSDTSAEVYWLSIEMIRKADRMTCGWSMEERFDLSAPPHPTRWDIALLAEPMSTDDGGRRLTRISPR